MRIILIVGGLVLVTVIARYCVWPTEEYYRKIITNADRIELAAALSPTMLGAIDVGTVTDPVEKNLLAQSIKFVGFWSLSERAIGNTWRIRAVRGQRVHDILVRGHNRLKHGDWTIEISDSLMVTFRAIVDKHGRWPTWEESVAAYERAIGLQSGEGESGE